MTPFTFDPALDLRLERVIDVPPSLVWKAWTTPEHLMQWFTPKPWQTVACTIDLRPGGVFHSTMQSPEGERFPNDGVYLEVIPEQRLTWTSELGGGFRPVQREIPVPFGMTASILMEPVGAGKCRYTAYALHADTDAREKHAAMGFEQGWGTALDQLVAYMKGR